jgi:hypothetical protein
MACSITITSVVGIPATPGSTTTSTIRVTGTQSGECPPAPSGVVEIIVQAICPGATNQGIATPDSLGNWAVDIPLRCTCNGWITVTASCATDPACMDTFSSGALQCEGGNCPTGSITASVGGCNSDGTRNVTLTATITSVPAGTIVGAFGYGGGLYGSAFIVPGAGTYTDTHKYIPPGPGPTDPASFHWTLPASCPDFTVVIPDLDVCECPKNVMVTITATPDSTCHPDGTRTVTFTPSVSGVTPQYYIWDFHGYVTPNQTTTTPVPVKRDYPAPGTAPSSYPVTLTVTSFSGACSNSANKTISVPGCGGGGGGNDGGGNGFGFCAALLVSAITLLVLGAALLIIGVCFSVPPLVTAGVITAALGLLLFLLWLAFCTHFTPCSVMRTMHCILFFLIAVVAPIIALLAFLFTGFSVCLLTVLGAWGGWGTIYAWLGVAMGSVGCTKTC